MKDKTIIGKRIKAAMDMKGYSQIDLAKALSEREVYSNEDTLNSYKTSVNRWIKGTVIPREEKILAIADILNIAVEYLKGEIKLPIAFRVSSEEQERWDNLRKKGHLLKYIEESLEYDIVTVSENGNPTEPLFYQIEREVRAFLIARLEGLGIEKMEDNEDGNNN